MNNPLVSIGWTVAKPNIFLRTSNPAGMVDVPCLRLKKLLWIVYPPIPFCINFALWIENRMRNTTGKLGMRVPTHALLVGGSIPQVPVDRMNKSCGYAPCGAMNQCIRGLPFAISSTEKRVMTAAF